jgi:hypothetical protein
MDVVVINDVSTLQKNPDILAALDTVNRNDLTVINARVLAS